MFATYTQLKTGGDVYVDTVMSINAGCGPAGNELAADSGSCYSGYSAPNIVHLYAAAGETLYIYLGKNSK